MKQLNVRLPDSLLAMLEVQAMGEHRSLSSLVRKILCEKMGLLYHEKMDETINPELPLS